MAATAWTFFKKAKDNLANGTLDMDTQGFKISLFTSACIFTTTASAHSYSAKSELTGEVSEGNGYSSSGKVLTSEVWTLSGNNMKFDASDVFWSANGGNIANIKYGVLHNSAGVLVAWSKLTTAQFTLTTGNRLTIQFAATGIFTLS